MDQVSFNVGGARMDVACPPQIQKHTKSMMDPVSTFNVGGARMDVACPPQIQKRHKKSTTTDPVSFNVGGQIFQVSRYLLDKHSETMLGTASSGYDSPEPIFLDGDAAIFAQVLIYLRHGSITLPMTIPKDMFVKELEYYDVAICPGSVKSDSEVNWSANMLARLSEDIKDQSNSLKDQSNSLKEIANSHRAVVKSLRVLNNFGDAVKYRFGQEEFDYAEAERSGMSDFIEKQEQFQNEVIQKLSCLAEKP